MTTSGHHKRIVIVANRLPFTSWEEGGELHFKESPGGLVSGLSAYLSTIQSKEGQGSGYVWIGWPGSTISEQHGRELKERALSQFNSHPVMLSQEEMDAFYLGFCNKTVWPLFHYFTSYAEYKEESWQQYVHVNEVFCNAVAEVVKPGDLVWVHDYHLMLLPKLLREKVPNVRIGFFLHIPFPSFEVFRLLPARWRKEILEGLLGADLTGFHTFEYMQHFLNSVQRILGYEHHLGQVTTPARIVKAGTFPMGLDFARFSSAVNDPEVQRERETLSKNLSTVKVILSVDRLDYTKGILNRLQGFARLLELKPEYRGRVVLLMVVVPSRIGVDQYEQMKRQIEELVGRINGLYGNVGWTPVIYHYRSLSFSPLIATYAMSDVALVTPLRDGMNLVAKEYVATRNDRTGVLILSEMAGAAKELGEAIIVNPTNSEEIAEALHEALEMPLEEQQRRNGIMQHRLQRYNVTKWASEFFQELESIGNIQNRFYAKLLPAHSRRGLIEHYRQSGRRLLFLDYDGTLVPFAQRPQLAKPTPRIIQLLQALSDDHRNTCVVVSGRDRETLQRWFGGLSLDLVAEHGVWIKEKNEDWKLQSQHSFGWKERIRSILELYADRLPGSFVEDKEHSVAFHYRSADPEQSPLLVGEMMDHLVHFTANEDIQVLPGHKVLEVRNAGVNKGNAALHWLSRRNDDMVLAIGDDRTDEDLFVALPQSAYSVRVGITNTHARYNLRNPGEVLGLLDQLVVFSGQSTKEGQNGVSDPHLSRQSGRFEFRHTDSK